MSGDERMERAIEEPVGGKGLGVLDLILLLESVDPVLALNVGLGRLDTVMKGVDGVGNILPVLLTEATAVELDVTPAPRADEDLGMGRVGSWMRVGKDEKENGIRSHRREGNL